MSYFKNNIISAIKSGDLVLEGDAYLNGEMIHDHVEQNAEEQTDKPTELGFIGYPDNFGCRRNVYVDEVINDYKKSDDKFERQAAQLAPNRFLFLDEDIEEGDLRSMYILNAQLYANVRMIQPLIGNQAQEITGRHFLPLGVALYPKHRNLVSTESIIKHIRRYTMLWILDKAHTLEAGTLESRRG